jgi:hypothetical protein
VLNGVFAVAEFIASGQPMTRLSETVLQERWTVHIGDPNAAASFFVLALGLLAGGAFGSGSRLWRLAAALAIGAALYLTGSRTAIAAVFLTVALGLAWAAFRRSASRVRVGVCAALAVVVVAALLVQFPELLLRERPGGAIRVRWLFLGTTLRMLLWQPLFGVGIGQYLLWSGHFSSAELLSLYRRENAHNNFAQVAGELGLVGLAAFVAVLVGAVWAHRRAPVVTPHLRAGLVGVVGFVLTWLGGHPLLVPAVSYPFWVVLGTVAGALPRPAESSRRAGARGATAAGTLAVVVLALSIPVRVHDKTGILDWTRVSYGFFEWERGPGGERFRWMGSRARWFAPADASRLVIPVRGHAVSQKDPIVLDVLVGDALAHRIEVTDAVWRRIEVQLPAGPAGLRRIDLRVSRTWIPAREIAGSTDQRRLGVQVGEPETIGSPGSIPTGRP